MRCLTYQNSTFKGICVWVFEGKTEDLGIIWYNISESKIKFCILKQICSGSQVNKTTLVCSKKEFK